MSEIANRHPNLVTWLVLAIGMLAVLFFSARDVALTISQWFWLGVATVLLAGLCAWIISWEADEDEWDAEAGESEDDETRGELEDEAAVAGEDGGKARNEEAVAEATDPPGDVSGK